MPKKALRRLLPLFAFLILPFAAAAAPPEYHSAQAGSVFVYGLPEQNRLTLPPVAPAAGPDRAPSTGHYLYAAGLNYAAVPAAPAEGSAQDKEDFRVIYAWQARRTPGQCAGARAEMSHSYEVFFGKMNVFGAATPPEVTRFFRNAGEDSTAAHKYLKKVYKRPRPFVRDAGVKPCLPLVEGFAYPSGHATMARLFALILADLVPRRRAEFMARADEAGLNRVIGGVHHPADIAAGVELAGVLYRNLMKEQRFISDMDALRSLVE